MRKPVDARLSQIVQGLEALASRLEDAGFQDHSELLDEAADKIEGLREAFAAL